MRDGEVVARDPTEGGIAHMLGGYITLTVDYGRKRLVYDPEDLLRLLPVCKVQHHD